MKQQVVWISIGQAAKIFVFIYAVLFVGLSTVVVQAMSTDAIRARALAIWAAAFVGMLPFGALLTAGLAAVIGPQYEAQCEMLCYGPYPSWTKVQARFQELKNLL